MLQQVSLMQICTCLPFAALAVATGPARVHEARQGPIATSTVSLQTSTSRSTSATSKATTTTMSSTSSSEQSLSSSSSSSLSPSLLTTSSITLLQPSDTQSHSSSASPTSSSRSASGTSSATPQPSSSPSILSLTVNNMTTCTSGLISWNYTGNEAELLLSITNTSADQTVDGTIQQQLMDTNTSASSWAWSSVNLTQGWYEIQGLVLTTPTVSNYSAPFFIANGTNVTCLTGASPSSAASNIKVANIVGGVVGTVAGVSLVIIAGLCFWSRKRKRPFIGGGKSGNRNWGTLKSTGSSVQPGESGTQLTRDHFHAHSESTAGVLEDVAGGKASATTTPGDSEEDTTIMDEEKLVSPASSSGMSPFDALNTPVHYDRRASMYYSVQIPTPVTTEDSRSRSASLHPSNQSIEQQAQRIRSSMEVSVRRRSERLSMPTLPSPSLSRLPHSPTHTQYKEEYPLSSMAATPVGRSISAGAVSATARRTSRKPVPQYDPSVLLEDTNSDSVSTFTAGAESSQSHGTGMGAGAFGTPTGLVHKASFVNGRPVHYLIPDMPPPQRD